MIKLLFQCELSLTSDSIHLIIRPFYYNHFFNSIIKVQFGHSRQARRGIIRKDIMYIFVLPKREIPIMVSTQSCFCWDFPMLSNKYQPFNDFHTQICKLLHAAWPKFPCLKDNKIIQYNKIIIRISFYFQFRIFFLLFPFNYKT